MDSIEHAQERAKSAAGNWRKFDSFGWQSDARPEDPDNWTIYHTAHRDSSILERSNAHVIERTLAPWTGAIEDGEHVEKQSFRHWAVGHIDALIVRVYELDTTTITPAFLAVSEMLDSLEDYPILDESHYSNLEFTEACDYWQKMSVSERVSYLQRARLPIFAARRDDLPEDPQGALMEALNGN